MRLHFLAIFLLIIPVAFSDIGPKPSADIYITYNGEPIQSDFKAAMLACADDPDPQSDVPQLNISEYDVARGCSWVPARLAWGGDCSNSFCSFTYMLPEEFRLALYLPQDNKVYVSQAVQRKDFNSAFTADIKDGALSIAEASSLLNMNNLLRFIPFLVALIMTVCIEMAAAFFYALKTKTTMKILIPVALANFASVPLLWNIMPLVGLNYIALAEVLVIVFEMLIIFSFRHVTLKRALILSTMMNLISIFLGGYHLLLFSMWI